MKAGFRILIPLCLGVGSAAGAEEAGESWREDRWRATLENESLAAEFQAGIPVSVRDAAAGRTLLSVDPGQVPADLNLFGTSAIDLDRCTITQEADVRRVRTVWEEPDGVRVSIEWSLDDGSSDLVLRCSAQTPVPVEEFRFILLGCDIDGHDLTWVDHLGVGHHVRGPLQGRLCIGDPRKDPSPGSQIHPLLALFEHGDAGWVVTGREERLGPASMMIQGRGPTAAIGFARRYPVPTREPALYEVRLRSFRDDWRHGVDPYVKWMEREVGFVPLERRTPDWIGRITNQAYVRVGDFEGLEQLATAVDPARTLVGRMVGFRHHPMGFGGPDFRLTPVAKRWFGRARELGFHVGAHFAAYHLSPDFPDLVERFRPGFAVVGEDEDGDPVYQTLPRASDDLPVRAIYVSHAYEPWRRYFIEQLREAVEAGVDLIYLDEAAWPCGNPVVDGVSSVQGLIALEAEILEAYPQVAIQTEQFNPMASRHAAFALCQMSPGHPLGGYIFRRFVKVVPEGINYQATETRDWDALASFGFMLPGSDGEPSWLEIARAFQEYELVPDIDLPRTRFATYADDGRHGLVPAWDEHVAAADGRLFGYRGRGDVTAYFEKRGDRRGLVLYEPGGEPRWFGERVTAVSSWPGPGVLRQIVHGVSKEVDWFLYDEQVQFGLNPRTTYRLDRTSPLSADRFHVTKVPADFALWDPNPNWIRPQDVGRGGGFFKLLFTGNGEMAAFVPENMLAFLDGRPLSADGSDRIARFTVAASPDEPGLLLAFVRSDEELSGPLADLPWQVPPLQRPHWVARHRLTDVSPQGPVPRTHDVNSFFTGVSAMIVVNGKLPEAESIRMTGAYAMRSESRVSRGDGVIRINGEEIVRVPAGEHPHVVRSFDADISAFASRHVLIELVCDGVVKDPAGADWFEPRIVVGR